MSPTRILLAAPLLLLAPAANAGSDLSTQAGLRYDSNVFLLDDNKKDNVDGTGDKYLDMESFSDWIVSAGAGIDLSTKAVGRRTTLRLDADGALYVRNSRRSYVTVAASLEQKLWKNGKVFARGDLAPARFRKNYAASVDVFGNTSYEPGVYTEAAASGGLATKLGRSAAIRAEGGIVQETWNAPFENRSDSAVFVEVDGNLELGKRLKIGAEYEFIRSFSPGDADPDDPSQTVDRSYASHRIEPSLRFELARHLDLLGAASVRFRDYLSSESGDPYSGHTSTRIGFEGGVKYSSGSWKLRAGYDLLVNAVNKGNGDELDYTKHVFSLGASYSF